MAWIAWMAWIARMVWITAWITFRGHGMDPGLGLRTAKLLCSIFLAWRGVTLQGKGSTFTWRNMAWLILLLLLPSRGMAISMPCILLQNMYEKIPKPSGRITKTNI